VIPKVISVLRWRQDAEKGEMIEQKGKGLEYCKTHLILPGHPLTPREMNKVCLAVNLVLATCDSELRVRHNTKRFLPTKAAVYKGGEVEW